MTSRCPRRSFAILPTPPPSSSTGIVVVLAEDELAGTIPLRKRPCSAWRSTSKLQLDTCTAATRLWRTWMSRRTSSMRVCSPPRRAGGSSTSWDTTTSHPPGPSMGLPRLRATSSRSNVDGDPEPPDERPDSPRAQRGPRSRGRSPSICARARPSSAGRRTLSWRSFSISSFATRSGWGAYRRVFAEYRALPAGAEPKTDAEKRDQWMVRFSRTVRRNLGPFFQAWGIPIPHSARKTVENLPPWMPPGFPPKP